MSVVAATVTNGQRVSVGTKSDCVHRRILTPYSNYTISTDMGIYLVRMQALQVTDNQIMCELLVASRLRVIMQVFSDSRIVGHSFFICSV